MIHFIGRKFNLKEFKNVKNMAAFIAKGPSFSEDYKEKARHKSSMVQLWKENDPRKYNLLKRLLNNNELLSRFEGL